MLTEEEKNLICQIVMDDESGNHLLRPRSNTYWNMREEVHEAVLSDNQDDRQKEIVEYFKQCQYVS